MDSLVDPINHQCLNVVEVYNIFGPHLTSKCHFNRTSLVSESMMEQVNGIRRPGNFGRHVKFLLTSETDGPLQFSSGWLPGLARLVKKGRKEQISCWPIYTLFARSEEQTWNKINQNSSCAVVILSIGSAWAEWPAVSCCWILPAERRQSSVSRRPPQQQLSPVSALWGNSSRAHIAVRKVETILRAMRLQLLLPVVSLLPVQVTTHRHRLPTGPVLVIA